MKTITAALAFAALLATSTVASAQLCIFGLMIAAIHTGATENRELTSKEAMTCGLVHETAEPKQAKKKAARAAKKKD